MKSKIFIILIILFLGIFLRLYQLNNIPPGLDIDEASFGYDASSILETGKDRYGEVLPFAFRSFGTYLLPVYAYLTVIPVAIFGPTFFSARLIAAVASISLILITYFLISGPKIFSDKSKLLIILLLSISPWAIFFGRNGHEASLSLAFFVLSILFFLKSLTNPKWLILTSLTAGLSGLTYYAERYLTLIFFPAAFWFFREKFIRKKKIVILAILVLIITMLPQLVLLQSGALTRRMEQVNYWNDQSFHQNGGTLRNIPFGKIIYIAKEFTSRYVEYFSPRSLFTDPDPQGAKSMPDLSVFYIWMVIPLWFGVKVLFKKISLPFFKILVLLMIVSPIPAALTTDPFYSIRTLTLFWVLTIIIAFGSDYLLGLISSKFVRISLVAILVAVSLISFYNSYFILLKHERSAIYGYEYKQLIEKLNEFKGRKVVVDASRVPGVHIWIPYYGRIDPVKFQMQASDIIKKNYYNNTDLDEVTKLDNFEIRAIIWKDDIYEDEIIIGDNLSISDQQSKEHNLTPLFQIKGLDGKVKLRAYTTNPEAVCKSDFQKGLLNNQNCERFIQ